MSSVMRKRWYAALLLVSFYWTALLFRGTALAASQAPLMLLEEDTGNGYYYEAVGIGRFTVNGKDYETVPAAAIDLETDMVPVLFMDGEEIPFESGSLLIDNGDYELFLYKEGRDDSIYAVYHFTVENHFQEVLGNVSEKIEVVENPPLTLACDPDGEGFSYTLPNGRSFWMNVPLGGTARHSARLVLPDGLMAYTMKKNGSTELIPDNMTFFEPGHYEIIVTDSSLTMADKVTYQTGIWFTLKNTDPEQVSLVSAPCGFHISSVQYEGESLTVSNPRAMTLKKDGTYEVTFLSEDGSGTIWKDTIIRDTSLPAIMFEKPVDGQVLSEEVAFLPPGRGERMRILCNGVETEASMNRISRNGSYLITIWDAAGNSREYRFIMKQGFDFFDSRMIIVLVVLVLSAGAVMAYWRRNMRVI